MDYNEFDLIFYMKKSNSNEKVVAEKKEIGEEKDKDKDKDKESKVLNNKDLFHEIMKQNPKLP